ncbi:50S ribosomal protein L23 [Candidatus Kaiserbacteria bacterium]|nr:50S ribosomal protein L23 [Candidatus Kaiserbacteria bacterium]
MALFSRKKNKEVEATTAPAPVSTRVEPKTTVADLSHVLMNPRITEKATMASAEGVYVFDVAERANKKDIARAVAQYYKVIPRKISVVTIPAKSTRSTRTGVRGVKQGGKKAYVYLKRGETITIA